MIDIMYSPSWPSYASIGVLTELGFTVERVADVAHAVLRDRRRDPITTLATGNKESHRGTGD
jgi:hypothetical protein